MRKFTEKELENLDLKEFLASSSGSDEELEDCNSKAPISMSARKSRWPFAIYPEYANRTIKKCRLHVGKMERLHLEAVQM